MLKVVRFVALLLIAISIAAPAQSELQVLMPLASGGAPPCPDHPGVREFRSATVLGGDTSAWIVGTARRETAGCRLQASLNVESGVILKTYALPNPDLTTFAIVDFSPDRSELLLSSEISRKEPDELLRYVDLSTLKIGAAEMNWQNVWDLLGWKDCDALLYPQGFSARGDAILFARPSVMSRPRRDNCVTTPTLYEYNQKSKVAAPTPDSVTILRYGKVSAPASQSCKSDPDIVGACFTARGRLSAWNGSPTWRISLTGTKIVLGVTASKMPRSVDVVLPDTLSKLDWSLAASGDFVMCPFTVAKSETMQMVCIESASKIAYHSR